MVIKSTLILTCFGMFWARFIDKTQGTDLDMWPILFHIAYTYVSLLYLCR